MTLASLRQAIGIVQQDVFLFSATIRDNIAYGAVDATHGAGQEAAKAAHIHDFIMSLPDGYDTWVGERGITLSGGQKQRIAIARTLLLDPRILILDDSTSSVDTQTEYLIQQALAARDGGPHDLRDRPAAAHGQDGATRSSSSRTARSSSAAGTSSCCDGTASTARSTTSSCATRKKPCAPPPDRGRAGHGGRRLAMGHWGGSAPAAGATPGIRGCSVRAR